MPARQAALRLVTGACSIRILREVIEKYQPLLPVHPRCLGITSVAMPLTVVPVHRPSLIYSRASLLPPRHSISVLDCRVIRALRQVPDSSSFLNLPPSGLLAPDFSPHNSDSTPFLRRRSPFVRDSHLPMTLIEKSGFDLEYFQATFGMCVDRR